MTVATVGYGDTSPVTPIGRGIAVFLMLAGIALIGILTATVASYFAGQHADTTNVEREKLREELARDERDLGGVCRLDPELKRDLLPRAMDEHVSVSELIRRAARRYLRASSAVTEP